MSLCFYFLTSCIHSSVCSFVLKVAQGHRQLFHNSVQGQLQPSSSSVSRPPWRTVLFSIVLSWLPWLHTLPRCPIPFGLQLSVCGCAQRAQVWPLFSPYLNFLCDLLYPYSSQCHLYADDLKIYVSSPKTKNLWEPDSYIHLATWHLYWYVLQTSQKTHVKMEFFIFLPNLFLSQNILSPYTMPLIVQLFQPHALSSWTDSVISVAFICSVSRHSSHGYLR